MDNRERIRAEQHLNLLGIAHMVVGGFAGFYALLALVWVVAAAAMHLGWLPSPWPDDDMDTRFMMVGFSVFFVGGLLVAGLNLLAGLRMRQFRSRKLCWWVAILNCFVFPPIGTLFGLFTLVLLSRKHIKSMLETS